MVSAVQLRKDAVRNREAILAAARELFADSADVSMCEVARRAGVGQATLYRNFPDRTALAAEVLNEHVERIEQLAARVRGGTRRLLRAAATAGRECGGPLRVGRAGAGGRLRRIRARARTAADRRAHEAAASDAKAAGTLRRDAAVEDVFLVLLMTRGAMERAQGAGARAAAAHRVLTLALDGLVPPAARA